MTGLASLLIPILLSAVIVFVVSAMIHMLPLWHRGDYPGVPDEDRVMGALGPSALPPGAYMVPRAPDMAAMRTPEFIAKVTKGPVMMLTVMPNRMPSMNKSFVLWFLYSIVMGVFAGYIAGRTLPPGTDYLRVFQLVGATAFVGYAAALWQMSIWFAQPWSLTIKATVDGLIYALVTAGTFGWLWPR